MITIQHLIGDYHAFFSDLLHRMKKIGVHITGLPIGHLLYRTSSISEYLKLRDELKKHCSEFVETQFNGRAISILILNEPLLLDDGFTVNMIELPAPDLERMYPSGLESIGVTIGDKLPEFIQQHDHALTGIKNYGEHSKPAYITFDNGKTAKFYNIPLREVVLLEGWKMQTME